MNRAAARQVRAALREEYPRADVDVQRDFGGLRASVIADGGEAHFWLGDKPGVLSAVLGLGQPDGDPDGGERLSA